ncbi:MAG: exopolyphosphatase [Flammeovirgaceae bacterium]|nr:MAG: exopolyphosphatase [Flammeovirgaceae bacterium]
MTNRIAIIDLGTNTFHLLVAEKKNGVFSIIHRDRRAVKIGKGGINQNQITDEGMARALETMQLFKDTLAMHNVAVVYAFGTSALRHAVNRDEVLTAIKSKTSIEVKVISGEEEAEYIYYGVRWALNPGHEKMLIMDIGGGSVEFIIANGNEIFWKVSLEIGAQRLLEKFQHHDPIAPEEIAALNDYFETQLPELKKALQLHRPFILAGSSGTFDTLSDIYCIQQNLLTQPDAPETPLTIEAFYKIYDELITKNRQQRLAIPGMLEMRVDMIVVACCLIRYVLQLHAFTGIRVSGYSMKEGVLARLGSR